MHKYKKYGIIIKFTACFFGKLGGRVLVMRKNVQNLRPSEHLRMGLIAFLVGIFVPISGFYMEVLVVCVLFVVAAVIFRKYPFVVLAIFCFAIFWGGWRGDFDFRNDELASLVGEEVMVEGTVTTAPDVREDTVRAFVETDKGNFLLVRDQPAVLSYGEQIRVTGKVTRPSSFGDFDYGAYLRRWGAQVIIKNPSGFEVIGSGAGNVFVRSAQGMRLWLEDNVRRGLPDPHATIAVGVLLGVKSELPVWTQEDFKRSGLQHLLVVSGSNVAIVLAVVAMALARFGRRAVLIGSLFALFWFVLLVGFDAPVLRAAVMGGVVGIAAALGRFSDARTLILLSGVIIGLVNPLIVRQDIGFHLSFLATVGIVLGTPVLLAWFSKLSENKWWKIVALMLAVSCAAQVAVLPVLGRSFGVFPVSGIVANLLAEPLVPLAMGGATVTALLGWLPTIVVKMISVPTFVVIEGLLWVAYLFGQVPPVEIPGWVTIFSFVVVLGFGLWGMLSRGFAQRWLERGVVDDMG